MVRRLPWRNSGDFIRLTNDTSASHTEVASVASKAAAAVAFQRGMLTLRLIEN